MMSEDIRIFEDFWKNREQDHSQKNWAISAFCLGMEVQAIKVVEGEQAKSIMPNKNEYY